MMKRFIPVFGLAALLCASSSWAAVIKTVAAGATDVTVTVRIIDSADGTPETGVVFNTSGIDLEYWIHGANAVVNITEATQTVNGAHTDGGFVEVGHGVYRLDLPDAAVATAGAVEIQGTVTGMIVVGGTVQISPPVNVVSAAGTAWASGAITAASIATDAIGAAEIAADVSTELLSGLANLAVNVAQVSGDSTAADTLETWLDGTAGPASPLGIARQGTAQSATGTTLVMDSSAAFADDTAIGMTVVACGSTQGYCQSRAVTANTLTDDTLTVDTWSVTPSGTITYYLFATAPGGGAGDGSGFTAIPWNASWDAEVQSEATDALNAYDPPTNAEMEARTLVAANYFDPAADTVATVTNLTNAPTAGDLTATMKASVNTEVDSAIETYHLDHLLAVDYDPASKPGTGTALLNELIESNAGVSRFTAGALAQAPTGSGESLADIADAVWDELLSGHAVSGSAGEALSNASSAGDPWSTALPGAYGSGTAGFIIGTNLDATVSSRASQTSVNDVPTVAEFEARTIVAADYFDPATDDVTLADGAHGGSSFTLTGKSVALTNSDAGGIALDLVGSGSGNSHAIRAQSTNGQGFAIGSTNGFGMTVSGATVGEMNVEFPWNADWDAEVQSEATDALNAYDAPTNAEMEARTLVAANYFDATTDAVNVGTIETVDATDALDARLLASLANQRILTGTCDSGSTTTCVDDALTQAAEAQIDDRLICFDDSWCAMITGFTPGTDTVTTTKTAPSTRASKGYTIFPATAQ